MRALTLLFLLACTPAPVEPAPLPTGPLGCGIIDHPCNCGGTIAVNYQVTPSAKCSSGRHIYYQCVATCLGGGWESACWCDAANARGEAADARH